MTPADPRHTLRNAAWRTSKRSQTSNCVEVAPLGAAVAVRDSKNRGGPVLLFSRSQWVSFIAGVRAHQFDRDN